MANSKTTRILWIVFLNYLIFKLCIVEATTITINYTDGNLKINKGWGCIEGEKKAFLEFKHGLKDPYGRLSSWDVTAADCCNWRGVDCNNQTGYVVTLALGNCGLGGEMSDSLLHLKHLNYLDLSFNNFKGIPIPNFFGSFGSLRYLNLYSAEFGGMIPPHLGNLSQLLYLDLNGGNYRMRVSNLKWLSGLSSLKYLDLGNVNLSKASTNWMQAVSMLPSLLELHLSSCELGGFFPQLVPFVNLTSLTVVDLSYNNFNNTALPAWLSNNFSTLGNLINLDHTHNNIGSEGIVGLVNGLSVWCNNSLEVLHLGHNGLGGDDQLPESLGNFNNLRSLDLSFNSFYGPFPNSFQHLNNLESLDLSTTFISGPFPTWIGNLSRMQSLDLSFNLMNGIVPKDIGQLRELIRLILMGILGKR